MTIAVSPTTAEAGSRPQGVPGPARPATPAHIIRDDAEAIRIAHELATEFREGASERDRTNARPLAELDAFSQSGLWSINVPKAFGGPEVSYRTLAQVIAIIAAADPSIAQIAQNHLGIVAAIRTVSDPEQQALLFAEVLKGTRFGNAFSERGPGAPPSSRPASPITATTSPCGGKNSIPPARSSPTSCPSSPSMERVAPGTPSPSAMRRG